MERRRWPDVVIVLAIIGLGLGGAWALWGDALRERSSKPPPSPPTATSPAAPMT